MAGKLITLPLRVSLKSAQLLTRAAAGAAGQALSLAGRTIGAVTPGHSAAAEPRESPERPRESPERPRESPERPRESPERPRESPSRPAGERFDAPPPPRPEPAPSMRPSASLRPSPTARPAPVVRQPPPEAPVVREPVHVSEEPELVAEFAEPGAEDGPGAAINVAEPWDGYERMNARDVIERARAANPAQLAAVRLYESRHRSRQTVLAAVDRQLRLGNGGAPA